MDDASKPFTFVQKIIVMGFVLALFIGLPLGLGAWFSQSIFPFFPGSPETSAQVEKKYTTDRPRQIKSQRNAYHLAYSYTADGQPLTGMAIVTREFYESVSEGQPFPLLYTSYRPEWSFPKDCPPSWGDRVFFVIAVAAILFIWGLGLLVLRYTIWPSKKASTSN